MRLIKPSYKIEGEITRNMALDMIRRIELAGRTCYKSEDKITDYSAEKFVAMLISKGHESVLEHEKLTIRFICDRGVSHEIVRHRLASFSQESTRYCDYNNDHIEFIIPPWVNLNPGEYSDTSRDLSEFIKIIESPADNIWLIARQLNVSSYKTLRQFGWRPEQARTELPNCLKTEIVVSANLRQWRLILKQRTANAAHPQMRELMRPLLNELKTLIPVIFEDINYDNN